MSLLFNTLEYCMLTQNELFLNKILHCHFKLGKIFCAYAIYSKGNIPTYFIHTGILVHMPFTQKETYQHISSIQEFWFMCHLLKRKHTNIFHPYRNFGSCAIYSKGNILTYFIHTGILVHVPFTQKETY
jgi:hypothetical protein